LGKFRKKPIVVEAITFGELAERCKAAETSRSDSNSSWPRLFPYSGHIVERAADGTFLIPTQHGPVTFRSGEWLITGVDGELYPCDGGVFEKTYEPAVDAEGRVEPVAF
jgi:hypothetical protein